MFGIRGLTQGEIAMQRAMFGNTIVAAKVRIYPRNFWWPIPNDRAMTPDGNIYFPSQDFRADFSAGDVPISLKALFMHESTHLYQWYGLGQWVFARGPFDRNYEYELIPGKKFQDYGLEQMGQIVQDYYTIKHGGTVRGKSYSAADYEPILPLRGQ